MATFVRLVDARQAGKARQNGLRGGAYMFPLTQNFTVAHQWAREVGRNHGRRNLVAVLVRLPDSQMVEAGQYNGEHVQMTASQAVAAGRNLADMDGFEVIVRDRILPKQIIKTYHAPRNAGWRYSPDAHSRRPCPCPNCQHGEPFSQALRKRAARREQEAA